MVRYMKCPRCELNYIDAEKQEYCDVCLKEMKGIPTGLEEIEEVEDEIPTELCPVCGENMMRPGEKMCDECRKKREYDEVEPDPNEDDDEWREYLDDTDDIEEEMGEIDESFDEEFDEEESEEEFESAEEDDLEYVTGDEIYALGDGDDDDDDF
ncbi:MAG: hypothetical protein IKD43_03685 [Clostridia bacterium]|nr:hypothetical protein [Clostridia bacterium]